jgi:hypothetical protein
MKLNKLRLQKNVELVLKDWSKIVPTGKDGKIKIAKVYNDEAIIDEAMNENAAIDSKELTGEQVFKTIESLFQATQDDSDFFYEYFNYID